MPTNTTALLMEGKELCLSALVVVACVQRTSHFSHNPTQHMHEKGTRELACGAERAEPNALAKHAHAQLQAASPTAHTAQPSPHPGIMQKPGIPAQQMQRTGTRERA